MNAFDYFFEHTAALERKFLAGPEAISFRRLYRQSLSLAQKIRKEIGEGNNILLLSPNNAFFITVYLAAIKSGNIIIPIDPMIESEGFNYIRRLTGPKCLFMTEGALSRLSLQKSECILAEDLTLDQEPVPEDAGKEFDEERVAEIIFTSGSTGIPNGVMLTHKNLIANTGSILGYLDLTGDDRMLVVLPFYYCYGLSLLHTHLRAGGSLVLNNSFIFLGNVLNDLKQYDCTGFAGVPSHFQILLRKSDSFRTTRFPNLRYVTQAGGKLPAVFIDEFREAHPDVRFYVMFGQTEATSRLSYLPPDRYEQKKGSVGKAIPGVTLKVVNESGKEVKPGETGEVIVQGDNVMKGYYRDEKGTAEVLRDGWLYTGDLGTVDEDGFIYLTARKKEILKVRGKRISPKEIEAVILELPGVIDCTVEGTEDEVLGEILKATLVLSRTAENKPDPETVKAHCSGRLELHKVPQKVEFIEKLNVAATGKKVKKTL